MLAVDTEMDVLSEQNFGKFKLERIGEIKSKVNASLMLIKTCCCLIIYTLQLNRTLIISDICM